MYTTKILLLTISTLVASTMFAQEKTDSFQVSGNCGMCENRIEKAATIEGVVKVDWSVDTKILTLVYDTHKVKPDEVQKKIADAGHDTEKFSAAAAVYNNLPGCCKYERRQKNDKHSGHQH